MDNMKDSDSNTDSIKKIDMKNIKTTMSDNKNIITDKNIIKDLKYKDIQYGSHDLNKAEKYTDNLNKNNL